MGKLFGVFAVIKIRLCLIMFKKVFGDGRGFLVFLPAVGCMFSSGSCEGFRSCGPFHLSLSTYTQGFLINFREGREIHIFGGMDSILNAETLVFRFEEMNGRLNLFLLVVDLLL